MAALETPQIAGAFTVITIEALEALPAVETMQNYGLNFGVRASAVGVPSGFSGILPTWTKARSTEASWRNGSGWPTV